VGNAYENTVKKEKELKIKGFRKKKVVMPKTEMVKEMLCGVRIEDVKEEVWFLEDQVCLYLLSFM
jgi:hypothetical protein